MPLSNRNASQVLTSALLCWPQHRVRHCEITASPQGKKTDCLLSRSSTDMNVTMECELDRIDMMHSGIQFSYDDIAFAPASTAHGTYYDGEQDEVENLDEYQEGGHHPVHIHDRLGTQRYRVIHKLGHGAYGTVWLCRDHQLHRYVAVKVMTADVSLDRVPEMSILKRLDQTSPGARHIALPLDSFAVYGPNGTHQCIVFPLLGQCVSPVLWQRLEHPGLVLRNLCHQAVLALNCLHESGVGHGGEALTAKKKVQSCIS